MSDPAANRPILDLFSELLDVPSPSGREERMAREIGGILDAWAIPHETDAAGTVLVRLAGERPDAPLFCVAAHMDELAMVVTRIEPDGSLRVGPSGGLHPSKLGEGRVVLLGDGTDVTGVLSMGSAHAAGFAAKGVSWDDVRIITGLSPADLKEAGVRPGSCAVPVRERRGPLVFGDPSDPLVGAWTFDDRMGVVALLSTLHNMRDQGVRPRQPSIFAFTVREEEGAYGAKALAQRESPDAFIAIDGCPMPPGAPLQLDGRPGIWSKDRLAHYDQSLVRDLMAAARVAGTELQPVVYDQTASDASLVFVAGAAPRIACFGHVRENSHGFEVARLSVFENVSRTVEAFITDTVPPA